MVLSFCWRLELLGDEHGVEGRPAQQLWWVWGGGRDWVWVAMLSERRDGGWCERNAGPGFLLL